MIWKHCFRFLGWGRVSKKQGGGAERGRFEMFCLNATGLKSLVIESQWGEWRRSLEFREELSSERRAVTSESWNRWALVPWRAFDYGLTSVTPGWQGVERGLQIMVARFSKGISSRKTLVMVGRIQERKKWERQVPAPAAFVREHADGWGFPVSSAGKESTFNAGDLESIPRSGRSLEEGMATHSSILAWRIPTDRGAWQSVVSPRVRHDWEIKRSRARRTDGQRWPRVYRVRWRLTVMGGRKCVKVVRERSVQRQRPSAAEYGAGTSQVYCV